MTASTAWKGLICLTAVAVAVLGFLVVQLFNTNHDALSRAKETACRIGGFLVDAPIVKLPGTSEAQFQRQVDKAQLFLIALRKLDCDGLGEVTTARIDEQLRNLQQAEKAGGGNADLNPPGGGGGSTTGNVPSSPATPPPTGGGGDGAPGPPGPTGPPGPPGTTTSPPPATTTTPVEPVLHRVCHVDPLLGRICRLVPQ